MKWLKLIICTIVVMLFFSCKISSFKEFYQVYRVDDKILNVNIVSIKKASDFGLMVNNGCYDSTKHEFSEDEIDSDFIKWLESNSSSYYCKKQLSRFSRFENLIFQAAYKKVKNSKAYYFYVFKGLHKVKRETSKVAVVLNDKEQLYAVNTTIWE